MRVSLGRLGQAWRDFVRPIPCLLLALAATVAPAQWQIGAARALHQQRPERSAVTAVRQRHFARLSADGTMPEGALLRAKQQRDALLDSQGAGIALSPGDWSYFGPGNIGGRIRSILIHPTNPSTIWLGSVGGGIWKSTDGGASWRAIDDFLPALGIGCMALDPTNPSRLLAGTGEGFFETVEGSSNTAALRGAGIYSSVDGGETWQVLASTLTPDFYLVTRLHIDPVDPATIVASTSTGLHRSTDGGATWSRPWSGWAYDVKANPNNRLELVAGVHDGPGVLWSGDGGQTWTAATGIGGFHRCELAWAKSANGTVFAGASNSSGRILVYRSTDFGHTWSRMTSGSGISTYEAYNSTLWVDPTNASRLVLGGVYVYRSTDSGVTLTRVFNNMHPDFHTVVSHPGYNGSSNRRVYFGHDGGISTTSDVLGSSYSDLNNGLGITQFYGVAVNDASGVILAGAQDNGTLRYTGNPNAWSDRIGGDGIFCASDPTDPNYFYGGYYYSRIFRSSDGGASFSDISNGITDRDSATNSNFIAYFTLDPNNPNRMLACARRLWRSNSVKGTPGWTIIKPPIANQPGGDEGPPRAHMNGNPPYNISTCTVAKGNSDVIWVGHNNGQVYKTTNGTAASPSWQQVGQGTLPQRWVGRIVIDPADHDRVYVAFLGWEADNIWRTTDGGATWTQITGAANRRIPSAPVSALALDPNRPGRLFAGTDIGVFTTWDDGATWSVESQGPGTVAIDELVWRNATTLVAATHGRGVWQAVVTPGVTEHFPTTYSVVRGFDLGGGVAGLAASDDLYLSVRRGVVANQLEAPINVVFSATAPSTVAQNIEVTLEAGVSSVGLQQTLEAYDFDAGAWILVDQRVASTADVVVTANLPGAQSRFIEPATREVRLRATVRRVAPTSQSAWVARFDLVRLRVAE